MDDVSLTHAKQHLEDLIQRAARGEDVRISDPNSITVKLIPVDVDVAQSQRPKRLAGRWKDRLPEPPAGFFDPLSEQELQDWYGDDA